MVGRPAVLPESEILARLRRRHRKDMCPLKRCDGHKHTYQEIATAFGVSYSAVYQAMRKAGLTDEGSRVDHKDTIPWTLRPEDRYHPFAMRLRLLGQVRRGDAIAPEKYTHLTRWVGEMIENQQVVCYEPGSGWWLDDWKPGDADLIRPPDYAGPEVYTDPNARKIWSISDLSADDRRNLIASSNGSYRVTETKVLCKDLG